MQHEEKKQTRMAVSRAHTPAKAGDVNAGSPIYPSNPEYSSNPA